MPLRLRFLLLARTLAVSAQGTEMRRAMACMALMSASPWLAVACPTDIEPRAPGILLSVQIPGATPVALNAAQLAGLATTRLT